MELYGLHIIDAVLIVVYLLGITAIGLSVYSRIKSSTDYFMGGRRFGKLFMIFFSFGAGTHTDQAVSVASKTYTSGLAAIWYQWLWLFCTPFYWLIAPLLRRLRALSMAEFFEVRYGVSLAVFYSIMAFLTNAVTVGTMLRGAGEIIAAVTGGQVPLIASVGVMTVLFVVYGVAGGLMAAVITDLIQGILTVILSFILLPFALDAVGGFSGLHQAIDDSSVFSLVNNDITVFFVLMMVVNGMFSIVAQPHVIQLCGAGKTEMDGRVGFTYGNFIKRFCTVAWCLTGLCAIVMYPNLGTEGNPSPDQAFGMVARDLLPKIAPGLLGIFIASMLAAVMSSCDALMNASAGLLTLGVYKPLVARGKSYNELFVGRLASLLLVAIGILIAFALKDVVQGIEIMWRITGMLGIAVWLGIFWRRATLLGGWVAALSAFGVLLLTSWGTFVQWLNEHGGSFFVTMRGEDMIFKLPWQMLSYLCTGVILGIVVSLCSRPRREEDLRDLFTCIRTPVMGEETVEQSCVMPKEATEQTLPKLIDHPDWEIPRFNRTDIVGFAVTWVCVAAIIGLVMFLARIGA